MAKSDPPVIVWFRRDLRLTDHAALTEAAKSDAPLLPLYILDDETPGEYRMGGASRWWLHGSLKALDESLDGHLILRKGAAPDVLEAVVKETGAPSVHALEGTDPWDSDLEKMLAERLKENDAEFHLHPGALLFATEAIETGSGNPYRVFTPFWKACLDEPPPRKPLKKPKLGKFAKAKSESLESLGLLPTKPDWAGGLRDNWTPGEAAAQDRLASFIDDGLAAYAKNRDSFALNATSRLSPCLHFGEISPNQIWHAVRHASDAAASKTDGADAFLRQIGWREFCHHLIHRFPCMPSEPLRPEFAGFRWREDKDALKAWQTGQTGYPIVDAAMRELWQTGFMPNRARMIVASFLVKHLLIPWQAGAEWFLDTLVDADLANNSAGWQWVAGCGTDAAPYFRVFNPFLQGQKFDADGEYVRTWVPELAELPASDIHTPWEAPDLLLKQASVERGKTYPEPIVDHAAARDRALAAFEKIRK